MKRTDPDAYSPFPGPFGPAPFGRDQAPGDQLPPAGPTSAWTAKAVIAALEPLVLPERLERLQGVLAQRLDSVTVVLDRPHDPHNGSAVLRSCDAFGVQSVHVLSNLEPFSIARKVAQGAERWVDVTVHREPGALLRTLRTLDYRLVVTHPRGEHQLTDLRSQGRVALLLGNEHDGVLPELAAAADLRLGIPMRGFVESLNMSVSAALTVQAATAGRSGDLSAEHQENVYARWLRATVPRADEVLEAL
jgi:tRNA (guanosine-2'-O-)-methyltransferase